jgi:hypothetical protein
MDSLYFADFIEAHYAYEKARYSSVTTPYAYLTGLLQVAVQQRLTVKKTQKLIDEKTAELQKDLAYFLVSAS